MRLNLTADSVTVDDDEGRICLIIETDEGDTVTIDIHGVALEFYANVQANLRPYALEAEHARATMPGPVDEHDTGYTLDDPKHPIWRDRVSAWADEQRDRLARGEA